MQQILTEEYFFAPFWQIIVYRMLSIMVFMLGIYLLMIKDISSVVFLAPLIFLIAISMLAKTHYFK